MKRFLLPLILTLILAACRQVPAGGAPARVNPNPPSGTPRQASGSALTESAPSLRNNVNTSTGLARSDGQGAVTVDVTPLNLDNPSDELEFDVAMNTHSVDLSMDLAALATLTTDTGITVQATAWDAQPGGHHVSGKLIFPAAKDGRPILEGASKLILTIINVDAPARVFEWQLK